VLTGSKTSHHGPSIVKKLMLWATDVLGSKVEEVKNIIIWGNHSATQFPDLTHGYLEKLSKIRIENKHSISS